MQLAQSAMWSAKAAGASDLDISDFMLDPELEIADGDVEAFFDFKPTKKKA